MFKKIIIHLMINLLIIVFFIGIYITLPNSYQSIDNRLRDFMFISRGQQDDSDSIRIVTIDEDSLDELGQWPWERNKIAQLLHNLSAAGAGLIAMDVFFSEQDKSSPRQVLQSLNFSQERQKKLQEGLLAEPGLPDYDQIMADGIGQTPTVLGYVFDLQNERNTDQFPMINANITEQNFSGTDFLPVAKGVTLNLENFQDKALSNGFLNNIPDESGMIRKVPLLIKYQEMVFTSLAMEVYRLLAGVDTIHVNYLPTGISSLELEQPDGSLLIPTDRHARLALNFLGPQKSFTYISAKDVINNTFDPALVRDKIILFGATSVGLMDLRATPFDNSLPGVEVHATAIENMLKQNFLHQPDWAEGATTFAILLIGIILTLVFSVLPAPYPALHKYKYLLFCL